MPVITNAGEYLITQQQQAGQPLIIDQMILANIAGLDVNTIPSRDQVMPAVGDVKITKPITKDGLLNSNTVVYSTVFPSTDGTFDFNWMGLYSSAHDTIIAVAYVPLQTKIKTVGIDIGNVITKNFAIEFNAAADITGINISAESWQIDYTARLMSMDKHQRDLVKNIYGQSTFLNDAFKVKYSVDKYYLTQGKAILGGLNYELATDVEITPGALPQTVWIDAYQETSMMGVLNKYDVIFNDGTVLVDYVDGAVEHSLILLGVVNSSVDVVDSRDVICSSFSLNSVIQYAGLDSILLSKAPSRGEGSVWKAGDNTFIEAVSGEGDFTTASGVKLTFANIDGEVTLVSEIFQHLGRTAGAVLFKSLLGRDDISSIKLKSGFYDFDQHLDFVRDTSLSITGAGMGVTHIRCYGIQEGIRGEFTTLYKNDFFAGNFTIGRPDGYTQVSGVVKRKGIYMGGVRHGKMYRIEEYGSTGFGISFRFATTAVFKECIARQHAGGRGGDTGTDGIHGSYIQDTIWFVDNVVDEVGDDALSTGGSYDGVSQIAKIFSHGNTVTNCGGSGQKLYNSIKSARVYGNSYEECDGGVSIYAESTSINVVQSDIHIYDNTMTRIARGSGEQASSIRVFHRSASSEDPGAINALTDGVYIYNNTLRECRSIFTDQHYRTDCKTRNVRITRNEFDTQYMGPNPIGQGNLVTFLGGGGVMEFSDNMIKNYASGNSSTLVVYGERHDNGGNVVAHDEDLEFKILRNDVDGADVKDDSRVFFIYQSNTKVHIEDNKSSGYLRNQAASNAYLIQVVTPNILSVIQGNLTRDNIGYVNAAPYYYSTTDYATKGSEPTGGTYERGRVFVNSAIGVGIPAYWECLTSGTSGALAGVTANTVEGECTIEVTSLDTLVEGQYISILSAGIDVARVIKIRGAILTLDEKAVSTQIAAEIYYVDHTWFSVNKG